MEESEDWVDVYFAKDYEVSSYGRVRNKKSGRFLKPCYQSTGNKLKIVYFRVGHKNIGKNLGYLIAEHFVDNPDNYKFLFYKNLDYYDNRALNLEWTELRQYHHAPRYSNSNGRVCSICNKFKKWDDFYDSATGVNGKIQYCMSCNHNLYINNRGYVLKKQKDYRENNKDIISERDKKLRNSFAVYSFFKDRLTPEESPKSDKNGHLLVKCTYCHEYFIPIVSEVYRRIKGINNLNVPEGRMYCSQECKDLCPIFYAVSFPKGFKKESVFREARDSDWTTMVLDRDNYICQECGSKNDVVAHHIIPVAEDFILSGDIDNGITLCKECHIEKHKYVDGCRNIDLANRCKSD